MAEAPDPEKQESNGNESEEEVAADTEVIFKTLMYERLTSQVEQDANEGTLERAPIPKQVFDGLRQLSTKRSGRDNSIPQELGQTLAQVGDQINLKYRDMFKEMIFRLNLSPDTAYDSFASIARRLVQNGINWGRIVALLYFGYEIAVTVIRRGTEGVLMFLKKIIEFVVKFVLKEKIARWIADQGGWKAFIDIRKNTGNLWFSRICALTLLSFFIIFFSRLYK